MTTPIDDRLRERLCEIGQAPGVSQSLLTVIFAVTGGSIPLAYAPADLSEEAIHDALVASVRKERKAYRKRRKAGGPQGIWPSGWESFYRTARNGCRFSKWCSGNSCCDPDAFGDRNHFSVPRSVTELVYGDTLAVGTYQFEGGDGSLDEPQVHVTWNAGDLTDDETLALTPEQALKFGAEVFAAADVKHRHDLQPGPIVDMPVGLAERLSVEVLPERKRRDGTLNREVWEFTISAGQGARHIRFAVDRSSAWFFGRYMVIAANDAAGRYVGIPHTAADVAVADL